MLWLAVAFMVGNKADQAYRRAVSEAEGKAYASSQRMIYIETSALTAANTLQLFESIARQVAMSGSASTAQQLTNS